MESPKAQPSKISVITHSAEKQTLTENGYLRGKPHAGRRAFYVELVRAMMIEQGIDPVIENLPLSRAMRDVQTKENIAFFNVTRTPHREDTVKWGVKLLETTSYFYELEAKPTGIKTLEDAKKVASIGVLRGGVHEAKLESQGFHNLVAVGSYPQILDMLKKGRIQLTPSAHAAHFTLSKQAASVGALRRTSVAVHESVGYLCFSKNVADELIVRWQKAYQQLIDSGLLNHLEARYLLPAPVQHTSTDISEQSLH
jgi:polar amino acid transport system substrate-binding protein